MKRLHSIAFRATKAECLDLPETTDIVRYVELEPAAMKIYRDLVRDSYAELGKGEVTATNILTRLLRLSQITGGFIGGDEGGPVQRVSTAKRRRWRILSRTFCKAGRSWRGSFRKSTPSAGP